MLLLLFVVTSSATGADPITLELQLPAIRENRPSAKRSLPASRLCIPTSKSSYCPSRTVWMNRSSSLREVSPDILYLNPSFFGYFVRQGFLEDLQPYVARDGFPLDQLYPHSWHRWATVIAYTPCP